MKPGEWVAHNNELYLVLSVDPRVSNYCRAIREDGMIRAGTDFTARPGVTGWDDDNERK